MVERFVLAKCVFAPVGSIAHWGYGLKQSPHATAGDWRQMGQARLWA